MTDDGVEERLLTGGRPAAKGFEDRLTTQERDLQTIRNTLTTSFDDTKANAAVPAEVNHEGAANSHARKLGSSAKTWIK
jgi:hypothetical protein